MRTQKFPKEGSGCGLSVRSRNRVDRRARNLPCQLHLCRYANAACPRGANERDALRHRGREHNQIDPVQQFFPLCAKDAGDPLRPQILNMLLRQCIFFRICLILCVRERHARPRCREIPRRRKPADARSDDERRLIVIGQFPVSPL